MAEEITNITDDQLQNANEEESANAENELNSTSESNAEEQNESKNDSDSTEMEAEVIPMSAPLDEYKILTIDDDKWIQRIFSQYMSNWGFKHLGAMDAISGINLAIKEKPLLIFLDVVLPEVNGDISLQFFKGIDAIKDIPVIIISANLNKDLLRNTHKAGASGFISKPFNQEILFDKIKEHLDKGIFERMVADGLINIAQVKRKTYLYGN